MDGISGVTAQIARSISDSGMTVMDTVNTMLLDKQLDNFQAMGDSTVRMMELSVNPSIGSNFDVSV